MSCIVVTTDFSPESKRAFAPVVDLARKLGLPIKILSVLEDVPFEVVAGGGLAAVYPDHEQMRRDQQQRIDELAADLQAEAADLQVTGVLVDAIDISRTIAKFAADEGAAFLAMASHGRSGLRRLLLGSVTEAVLRHAHTPIVVFPPPPE
jgi:nucleotide-binding universal stress UspA family protein